MSIPRSVLESFTSNSSIKDQEVLKRKFNRRVHQAWEGVSLFSRFLPQESATDKALIKNKTQLTIFPSDHDQSKLYCCYRTAKNTIEECNRWIRLVPDMSDQLVPLKRADGH